MAPPTSLAWSYFTVRDHGQAQCHLCHKLIRLIKNTSPLIAHLRCKHPEVLNREKSGSAEQEVETADSATQTFEDDFESPTVDVKKEEEEAVSFDMKLRMREMMALRLDEHMAEMQARATTNPMAQLLRTLCESSLWMIRDWPSQKIDDLEAVRATRLATVAQLRQLLRPRPPKYSEVDELTLLLADAMLTISEQWPGGDPAPLVKPKIVYGTPSQPVQQLQQKRTPIPQPTTTVVWSLQKPKAPGSSCRPPAPKVPRLTDRTTDGYQQLSTSLPPTAQRPTMKPHREMPQSGNAGSPSRLWTFFTKVSGEPGVQLAECNLCKRMINRFNYGTSDMKSHLKAHHPEAYATLGMENSAKNQLQPSAVAAPTITDPAMETNESEAKPPATDSSIVSATSDDTPLFETSTFCNDNLIKEEDIDDFDETNFDIFSGNDSFDEPVNSEASTSKSAQKGSDIWSYFRKEDVGEEKHGFCNLCDWTRKIYNHGTNTMWGHLKKMHPYEHSMLKPQEYPTPVHAQYRTVPPQATVRAVAEGAPVPSHLTPLPRPPK